MNLFLNYLVVAALFALVLLPTGLGIARERRIDRQLREAEWGEAAFKETESALPVRVRTGPAVLKMTPDQPTTEKKTEESSAHQKEPSPSAHSEYQPSRASISSPSSYLRSLSIRSSASR